MQNERDRLVELMAEICEINSLDNGEFIETDVNWNDIADHLIEKGVILPPVVVGQKVWYIEGGYYKAKCKKPREIEVTEVNHKFHGKVLCWGFIANNTRYRFSSIGKTVFLTREEAEESLRKEQKK